MSSSSSSESYGSNIVINGNFNGNADGWILSGGMRYEDYHIVAEPSSVHVKRATQSLPIVADRSYLVKYTVAIAGKATSSFSLGNQFISYENSQGILSSIVTVENTEPLIINVVVQRGEISITNVSVQELLSLSSSSSFSSQSSLGTSSSRSSSTTSREKTTSSSLSSISSSSEIKTSSSSSSSPSSSRSISLSSSSLSSFSSASSWSSRSESSSYSTISYTSSSSSSSLSSLSSSSLSSSSLSSLSSSSLSSSSSRSSRSSLSSQFLTTSSSISSLSSLSSSSSFNEGYSLIPFTFEASSGKQVWCFAEKDNYIYAGTGPSGKIIRSSDYYNWEDFKTVGDSHVKSLFLWANGLFIGTEPHGKIYVHNFTSDKFYQFVQTEDSCISCFAEYQDKLYVGTSPIGIIYQFNGDSWSRLYQPYGKGINSMTTYGGLLYVFLNEAEVALTYDGTSWKIMHIRTTIDEDVEMSSSSPSSYSSSSSSSWNGPSPTKVTTTTVASQTSQKENKETFYSFRNVKHEPVVGNNFLNRSRISNTEELSKEDIDSIKPLGNVKSILSSFSDQSMIYMGSDKGTIFSYPSKNNDVKILYQTDDKKIRQILAIDKNKLIVAIDNKLYLIEEGITDDNSSSSSGK